MDKTWVQSIIALVTTGSVVAGFFVGKIDAQAFIGLMGVSIGFFFNQQAVVSAMSRTITALRNIPEDKK